MIIPPVSYCLCLFPHWLFHSYKLPRHFKKGLDVHLILIPAYVSFRLLRFLSVTKTVTSGPICNSELPVLPISDLRQLLSLCISQGVIAPTFCYLGFTGPFCPPDNYQVFTSKNSLLKVLIFVLLAGFFWFCQKVID